MIPHYTKILSLGSKYTENAMVGEVILQEKVDGSQFRFGIDTHGNFVVGSKSVEFNLEKPEKLFLKGIEYVVSIRDRVQQFGPDSYFYAEFLEKPKHNVLK